MVLRSRRHFPCGREGLASAVLVEHNPQPTGPAGQTLAALEENSEAESIHAITVCARAL